MQKKGELSRLTINLLISSLIIILGIIIWIILHGINNGQEIFTDENIDLKISQVKTVDDNTLDLNLKRGIGEGEFVGLSFVVSDGSLVEVVRINSSMPENQTGNFSLNFILVNASRIKKISVTPIYINEKGIEVIGNVKDEYVTPNTCSNYCPIGAQCGFNDCGMQCGSGCNFGYLCLNYKCIKQQSSSVGSGGGSGGSSDGETEEEEENEPEIPCTPTTCLSLGRTCGTILDGCSGTLNCGRCATGFSCAVNGTCIKDIVIDCGEITCKSGEYCSNGACLLNVTGNTYFVATWGNDNDSGNFTHPWGTWQKSFETADAGDIVYFRGGVWYPTKKVAGGYPVTMIDPPAGYGNSGTEDNWIIYSAYPLDYLSNNFPILDGSIASQNTTGNIGVSVNRASYIKFIGLTVRNVLMLHPDHNVIGFSGNSFETLWFENCVAHDIGGTGFWTKDYNHTIFINCDSYNNCDNLDPLSPGGDGDGFCSSSRGLATDLYKTSTFIGCRSWNNSDDGFDLGTTKQLYFYNNWVFSNGRLKGDGNGVKLSYSCVLNSSQRIIADCITANNEGGGISEVNLYDSEFGPVVSVYNWLSYKDYIGFSSSDSVSPYDLSYYKDILKNNIVYLYLNKINFPGPAIFKAANYTQGDPSYVTLSNNTFQMYGVYGNTIFNPAYNVTDEDFVNLDTEQLLRPRKSDGSLPDIAFGHLAEGSDLIDGGVVIEGYHCSTSGAHPGENCKEWYGAAPDLGPFESNH